MSRITKRREDDHREETESGRKVYGADWLRLCLWAQTARAPSKVAVTFEVDLQLGPRNKILAFRHRRIVHSSPPKLSLVLFENHNGFVLKSRRVLGAASRFQAEPATRSPEENVDG